MFDDLLKMVMGAASVRPEFTASRCIAVKRSPAACRRCEEVCPHDAVTVHARSVEIDDVDCSGCGLCVQVCPSQALEPKVQYEPGTPVKCSQVAGDAQTVHCLGRLQPTDVVRLAHGRDELVLARGDCARCPVGTAAMAEVAEHTAADARTLLALRGQSCEVEVQERERLDERDTAERIDRRALLRSGWRGLQRRTSDALAPLDPGDAESAMPREATRRYRVLELADLAPEHDVDWPTPRIADGCILCPTCTRVCPTDAFWREYPEGDEAGVLMLDPARCVGCDACVDACPVKVIDMEPTPTWGEVSGGPREVYRRRSDDGPAGSVAR